MIKHALDQKKSFCFPFIRGSNNESFLSRRDNFGVVVSDNYSLPTCKWFCLEDRKRAMTFPKKYGYVSTRRVKKEINRLSLFSSGTPVTPSHWDNWIRRCWVFLALSRKRSLQRDDATCEKAGTSFLDHVSLLLSCYQSHNRRFRYRNGRSPMACLRANCSRVN